MGGFSAAGVDFACQLTDPIEVDIERFEKSRLVCLRIRIDFQERSSFDEKRNLKGLVITPEAHTMHRLVIVAARIGEAQRHALSLITGRVCGRRSEILLAMEPAQ